LDRIIKYKLFGIEPRFIPDLEGGSSDSEEHEDSPLEAYSATCRRLFVLARPRIIETVKVYDEDRAKSLLVLINTKPEISPWLLEVHIRRGLRLLVIRG
jgi:hypothetical protein